MKTTIYWHNVKEELPEKSGYYLVLQANLLNTFPVAVISYSSKYKKFNALDDYEDLTKCIEVDYWAEVTELANQVNEQLHND